MSLCQIDGERNSNFKIHPREILHTLRNPSTFFTRTTNKGAFYELIFMRDILLLKNCRYL